MLKQRARLVACLMGLFEMILVAVAFQVALRLRATYFMTPWGPLVGPDRYPPMIYAALPLWVGLFYLFGLYQSQRTQSYLHEIVRVISASLIGMLLIIAGVFIGKAAFVSRLLIVLFGLMAMTFLVIERMLLRAMARYARSHGRNSRQIIIVGTGRRAREVADRIEQNKHWGLQLVGYIQPHPHMTLTHLARIPVLGGMADLPRLLTSRVVDEIIFAVSRKDLEHMEEIFLLCESQGICTRVAVNFFPQMIAKVRLDEFHGVPLLTFSTTSHNEFALMAKRVFDFSVSFAVLVFFSPFWMGLMVLLWAISGRPIFFRQVRVGRNGRHFVLYKFRSMRADAEQIKKELAHLNQMEGPAFKIKEDPRITPLGRFLRRTSLDEIPQLYNVLCGEMSLVGPRPPLPEEVAQYDAPCRRRLSVKPGMTGLWQVYGRNAITNFKKWVELDLHYIDHWSFFLDLKICFRTLLIVLLGKGAS